MRALVLPISIAVLLCLGACDRASLMKKVTPAADESYARRQVDLLRAHQFERIESELDSSISDSDIRSTLSKMAALFPSAEPKSVKVVGVLLRPSYPGNLLTLEYEFPQAWLLVNMSVANLDAVPKITVPVPKV